MEVFAVWFNFHQTVCLALRQWDVTRKRMENSLALDCICIYRQTSKISDLLVGSKHHSDVVGASPVGAAPTVSSFATLHLASKD